MSAALVEQTADAVRDTDSPITRHWGWRHNPTVALCGARLMGIPAPLSHPYYCEECERLHLEWLRSVEF